MGNVFNAEYQEHTKIKIKHQLLCKNHQKKFGAPKSKSKVRCVLNIKSLGRLSWGFLHSFSFNIQLDEQQIKNFTSSTLMPWLAQYPCGTCRLHVKTYMDANKFWDLKINTIYELQEFLVKLHNQANTVTNKPHVSLNTARILWTMHPH